MNPATAKAGQPLSPAARLLLGSGCLLLLLALLIGAAAIPFLYESQSIRYKFGLDKALLRTGKICGLLAASLLLLQLLLRPRTHLLARIFGPARIQRAHQTNGAILVGIALIHPLLVFAPESISTLPVEWKYWPEVLGGLLLMLLWLVFGTAQWQAFLAFPLRRWRLFHRIAAVATVSLLTVHVLFVSDTFAAGPPRMAVAAVITLYSLLWCWVRLTGLRR